MDYQIKLAETKEEREAIYRLRYDVFIEELDKSHIQADHERKMLYDEADEKAKLFYLSNESGKTIATVRAIGGLNPVFPSYAHDLFKINQFEPHFKPGELALADRIIVDPDYRNLRIGDKLHQASFLQGIEWGTKLCFCSCDGAVLLMYFRYGWRSFAEPEELPFDKKRFPLLLILNDREFLQRMESPYLEHFPNGVDEKDECARMLHQKMNLSLFVPYKMYQEPNAV